MYGVGVCRDFVSSSKPEETHGCEKIQRLRGCCPISILLNVHWRKRHVEPPGLSRTASQRQNEEKERESLQSCRREQAPQSLFPPNSLGHGLRGNAQTLDIPLSHTRKEVRLTRLRVLICRHTLRQRVARQGLATDMSNLPPDTGIAGKRQDTLHRSPRIEEANGVFWYFQGGVGVANQGDALVGSVFGQRCN